MQLECFQHGEHRDVQKDHWWIALVDGEPAGFGCLAIVPYPDKTVEGYHAIAGVLPKFRGRRIQSRLIKRRESYAKRHGCMGCISYTAWFNRASANNLIREGYCLYKPQKDWGLKGALYFRKVFSEPL
jgi:GNAT superfamily N-acetyltransferase